MKKTFLILTLLLVAARLAPAQEADCQNDGPERGNCEQPTDKVSSAAARSEAAVRTLAAAIAPGPQPAPGPISSPFRPETPTDNRFITNGGGGLDTGCTYRSGGPLRIEIPIKRVVGETDGEGKLTNPAALVANGIIPRGFVTLSMPAFDVDVSGSPPEVDVVEFNGERIGQLTGGNGIWKKNTFSIPIDKVHFGIQDEGGGGEPGEGVNVIEILIDQASGSAQNWCTSIDWAELTFEAMYPVVMVHGNSVDGSFWSRHGFVEPFKARHIPYDDTISMVPNQADIVRQSEQLMHLIKERAEKFGVDHLHLVAHSKGGLDVRDFLVRRIPELRAQGVELGILSVSTLSTPHHGSAGADYVLDTKQISWAGVLASDNRAHAALAKIYPDNPGYPNLRTDFVQRVFNPSNRPLPTSMTVKGKTTPVHYYSFAADANADNSINGQGQPTIEDGESDGMDVGASGGLAGGIMQTVYLMLGTVSSTYVATVEQPGVGPLRIVKENLYSDGFRRNDLNVTVESARYPLFTPVPEFKANHGTIARPDVAESVINAIRSTASN